MALAKRNAQVEGTRGKQAFPGYRLGRLLERLPRPLWLIQMLKFLSVGVINTLVDASLYFVLTRWLGFAELQVLAKAISYGAGICNSFFWNKSWTFKSEDSTMGTFILFVLVKLVALGINTGLMHVILNVLGLPELLSLALVTGTTIVWNFGVSKFVVFKK